MSFFDYGNNFIQNLSWNKLLERMVLEHFAWSSFVFNPFISSPKVSHFRFFARFLAASCNNFESMFSLRLSVNVKRSHGGSTFVNGGPSGFRNLNTSNLKTVENFFRVHPRTLRCLCRFPAYGAPPNTADQNRAKPAQSSLIVWSASSAHLHEAFFSFCAFILLCYLVQF